MVVILSHQHDLCASLTYKHLRRRGAEVVFIEDSQLLTTIELNWSLARSPASSFLTVSSPKVPFANISSILARMHSPIKTDPDLNQHDQEYIRHETQAAWMGMLHSLDCRVINRPIPGITGRPIFTNRDHVGCVTQCRFKLPATLVTSSSESAFRFYDCCGRRAILRSPSGQIPWWLISGTEGAEHVQAALARHPVCLQQVPCGTWLQVFTVGDRAFGASDQSDLTEGGNAKVSPQAFALSPELRERCCLLAQALSLDFSQMQLLRTEQGEVYCFDVSIFPTYDNCEERLQEGKEMECRTEASSMEQEKRDKEVYHQPLLIKHGLLLDISAD
jgi:hypothetical protein